MRKNKDVNEFIENSPEDQQEILQSLRKMIEEAVPHAEELYKWSRPVYATEKDFAYLQTTKKHVALGIFNFEKVEDTEELLEGTGKQMRHIKIRKKEDIKPAIFSEMLQQAASFESRDQ